MNLLNVPNANKCYFIDGPGGTGKTYLFKVSKIVPVIVIMSINSVLFTFNLILDLNASAEELQKS